MTLELVPVLLGVCAGAVAVLYAAPKGYFGRRRKKEAAASTRVAETTYAPVAEQVESPVETTYNTVAEQTESPTETTYAAVAEQVESPTPAEVAEPSPIPAPALYETVQPEVSPPTVTYSPSSAVTFGASPVARKPTRTYRRRSAPVRSTSSVKTHRSAKSKKQ